MKKIVLTTAAASLGLMLAVAGSANAEGRSMKSARPAPAAATGLKIKAAPVATANVPDNTAHEWTAGCYAEFGPDAKYPDADLLEKCLN